MPDNRLRKMERPIWGYLLLCLYLILILLLPLLAHLTRTVWPGLFLGAARALGLVGFSILAIQVALGSRLKFIDRPWGMDRVMRFHKWAAIGAFVMLLLHPLTLLVTYAHPMDLGYATGFAMLRTNYGGIIALASLVAVVLSALLLKKIGLEYQLWRYAHKGALIVVVVGFVHGLRSGEAMPAPMQVYFWALLLAALFLFFYSNIYMKLWGRSRWRVDAIIPETHDTYSLALRPHNGEPLHYRPGQFVQLRLDRPGRPSEEHPFTASASPTGAPPLTVTIKESGDFTDTISKTRPGDGARIEGPFGRFSFQFDSPVAFVFIAGGVGITPVLSMLRFLRDTGDERRAVLIYGNHTEADIIARGELEAMPANIEVYHTLNAPPEDWDGLKGHVCADTIEECAGDLLTEADIYLCGPPPMMHSVTEQLKSLGVPRRRIHSERFAL